MYSPSGGASRRILGFWVPLAACPPVLARADKLPVAPWIPAFAGMTNQSGQKVESAFDPSFPPIPATSAVVAAFDPLRTLGCPAKPSNQIELGRVLAWEDS